MGVQISIKFLFVKGRGPGISRLLSKENRSKIKPKETLSCLILRPLFVFTRHLEILVTTLPLKRCKTELS